MDYSATRVWQRAQQCIAQQTLTNSKHPRTHVAKVYPTHVKHGRGATLIGFDDKEYIDFICGLGTNLLGYGNPLVTRAAHVAALGGMSHSLPTHHEIEAAEKLKEFFPFIDLVKWLKTGTDACSAAIRIARAHTGRKWILSDGYHGWSDAFTSLTEPATGVEDYFHVKTLEQLSDIDNRIAAVIVEPIITDRSKKRIQWLHQLREACNRSGTMLIFDEVITGFRYEKYGVSNCYGVIPDLICLGKAIANGYPLACVAGKEAWMNDPNYFVSSTYASEVSSLAAAKEVMTILQTDSEYSIPNLWADGERFLSKFNMIAPDLITIEGYPTRGVFKATPKTKALFFQECCQLGILFGPSWFYNFDLMKQRSRVLEDCEQVIQKIIRGDVELIGEMPKSPFAAKVRERQ
jgi:glutamate-1-semialdehyde aminotransferase